MAIIIVVVLNTANSVATVEMGSSMMQLERSVIMDIYIMEHQPTHVLLIARVSQRYDHRVSNI
jgi:hypothetical protein